MAIPDEMVTDCTMNEGLEEQWKVDNEWNDFHNQYYHKAALRKLFVQRLLGVWVCSVQAVVSLFSSQSETESSSFEFWVKTDTDGKQLNSTADFNRKEQRDKPDLHALGKDGVSSCGLLILKKESGWGQDILTKRRTIKDNNGHDRWGVGKDGCELNISVSNY